MPADSSNGWALRRRVELSGGRLAYDVFGEGPPVVLVHGTPSWSYLWRNVVPALSERFTVYVYDLLGYGNSPASSTSDLSIAAHGRRLGELLEYWQLERPAIAGHDIGGAVALSAHLLHDRAVRRLALVDAVVLSPWITPTTRHIQSHVDAYRTMPLHIYEQIVAAHIRTAVARPLSADAFAGYLAQWRGREGQEAYLRKVVQFDEAVSGQIEPLLATMATPVLLLWGEADAWLEPGIARRLQRTLPNAELSLIPDAGHFSPEDAPDEVAAALLEFFTG
jgi:pimeloyl-ACP methyl ester carboxylesterase